MKNLFVKDKYLRKYSFRMGNESFNKMPGINLQ